MAEQPGSADRPSDKTALFAIEGKVQLEGKDQCSDELPLRAFAFGQKGDPIGTAELAADGSFIIAAQIEEPQDIKVLVGPAVAADLVREANGPSQRFAAGDWVKTEVGLRLYPQFVLPKSIWWLWWPIRVCVRGRVRKARQDRPLCPVPFAQVEVYDVDREGCLWPWIAPNLPSLFDRSVIRLPDLLKLKPVPPPHDPPGPISPITDLGSRLAQVALNPQPLPPAARVAFDPQPEPPAHSLIGALAPARSVAVGEVGQLPTNLAARLQDLTVASRIAPWLIWPRCFYSKSVVCETTTDCDGRFTCCFRWWPFHIRNGRLRFDARPDILVKVSQVIGATTRTIYLDPYTSTRWDSWGAYLDLVLDDEDIVCGSGCTPQPVGTATHFVRVGNDEVYRIDQANGVYDLTRPGLGGTIDNMAYGGSLNLHAVFGDALSGPAIRYYYRLSILGPTTGGEWKDIKTKLTDTRVHKVTNFSEDYDLGPSIIGTTHNLYEVRDTATYHWYNQDWVGTWFTSWPGDLETYVPDEGLYTLRLEVFDNTGVKLGSLSVDYRDGTVIPPAVLPPMMDACFLVMQIDNVVPTVELSFPAVVNGCGVVPIAATPFNFLAKVDQENGRLSEWSLSFVKGLAIASGTLASASSDNGLAVPVSQSVSSAPMTVGLTGTCAFSLYIDAWAHIRNGYGRIYHTARNYALAVDACRGP